MKSVDGQTKMENSDYIVDLAERLWRIKIVEESAGQLRLDEVCRPWLLNNSENRGAK